MNILAIADRPPRISVLETLRKYPVDLIITLGDLGFFELRELQFINSIPKIGVYGNHCSGAYFDELGIMNMHLKTWQLGGLTFGGFEGSVRYKADPSAIMYTQEEANTLLKNFPAVDVFIAHSPPIGINDDQTDTAHIGLQALRTYVDTMHPRHFLHGHTYPSTSEQVRQYGSTQIHYVYGDILLSIA